MIGDPDEIGVPGGHTDRSVRRGRLTPVAGRCRSGASALILALSLSLVAPVVAQTFDESIVGQLRELKDLCTEELLDEEVCVEMQRRILASEVGETPSEGAAPESAPAVAVAEASAREFRHSAGLSFSLPRGWIRTDPQGLELGFASVEERLQGTEGAAGELEKLKSALQASDTGLFTRQGASLLVRPQEAAFRVTAEESRGLCERIAERMAGDREMHACELREIADRTALYVEQDAFVDGVRTVMYLVAVGPKRSVQFVMDTRGQSLATAKDELREIVASASWE